MKTHSNKICPGIAFPGNQEVNISANTAKRATSQHTKGIKPFIIWGKTSLGNLGQRLLTMQTQNQTWTKTWLETMGSQTQYCTLHRLVSSLTIWETYKDRAHTSKMTWENLHEGSKSSQNNRSLFIPGITIFCCHCVITNLKVNWIVKISSFFEKSILLFNLFALKVIISNKWSLCKLNKIRTQRIG